MSKKLFKGIVSSILLSAFCLTSAAAVFAEERAVIDDNAVEFQLTEENSRKGYGNVMYSLDMPSKREIQSKYFELGMDKEASTVYAQKYSTTAPYSAGSLSSGTLQQALDTVNFIRYTAGLDSVTLNDEYNNLAQHASLVNAVNNEMSHTPVKPSGMSDDMYDLGYTGASSSNLGYWYSSVPHSIIEGYMQDTDSYNLSRVGHRRWILNPPMKQIGFGMVGIHTATYVFDNVFGGELSDDYIAWPPENMPYELYTPSSMGYAFSVNLGYYYDTPSAENVTVTVYSKQQDKTWQLDKNSTDMYNGYLNVENSYYGMNKCIIFNTGTFSKGDEVTVTINGIYKNGVHSPINYTVDFFSVYDEIKIEAPDLVTASLNNSSITLNWNKVNEATSYRIYRAATINGTKTHIGTVTTDNYTDTNITSDTNYYYYVQAYDSVYKSLSDYSSVAMITTPASPSKPQNVKAVSGGGNATITWDKDNGATSYRVFRSTSLTGARERVSIRTSTYYIDKDADTGKTYYYWIQAYNANTGLRSPYSAASSVKIVDTFNTKPVISTAKVSSTKVTLTWNVVPGATSYRIYKRDAAGNRTFIKSQSMTEYTATGLTKGQIYRYEVRAYSATTNTSSAYSAIKSAKPMAAPTITSANANCKITWDKNLYATSYRVYRSASETGAKKLLNPVGGTTYTDTTAVSGTTYYYWVAAYDSETGSLTGYSAPRAIKKK